jgi:hypothetical protein
LLIDESDDGDRSITDKSGQTGNVVEYLLARSSQNSKAAKTFEQLSKPITEVLSGFACIRQLTEGIGVRHGPSFGEYHVEEPESV